MGQTDGAYQSSEIDKCLKREKKAMPKIIKILLLGVGLGAGESGKSTIIKQMRIIYSGGFSDDERLHAREVIFANLTASFKILLHIMGAENLEFSTECDEVTSTSSFLNTKSANVIRATNTDDFSEATRLAVCGAMKIMWEDEGVQEAVAQSRHLPFHDDLIYFYNSIGRISAREWLPSNQDILQTRLKTTGISETFLIWDP
ncbi:hypothetical protein N7451_012343 [Penicillium sp. IBT 35674x]|nr:hypothetical protein N7451_012343 [Penicillium sp. IBT 35674x]